MPLDPPGVHPELPWTTDALVADAVLRTWSADPTIAGYFGGRIYAREQSSFTSEDIDITAPELGVVLVRTVERRSGSSRTNRLDVDVAGVHVFRRTSARGTQDWLHARLAGWLKAALAAEAGVLRDPAGERLTEALIEWAAAAEPRPLAPSSDLVAHVVGATFTASIREDTRETV